MIFPLEKLKILRKILKNLKKWAWLGWDQSGGGHQNGKKFLCISGRIRPFRSYKTGWSPRLRGSSETRISAPIWSVSSRSPRLVITSSIIPLGSGSAFWGISLEGKKPQWLYILLSCPTYYTTLTPFPQPNLRKQSLPSALFVSLSIEMSHQLRGHYPLNTFHILASLSFFVASESTS